MYKLLVLESQIIGIEDIEFLDLSREPDLIPFLSRLSDGEVQETEIIEERFIPVRLSENSARILTLLGFSLTYIVNIPGQAQIHSEDLICERLDLSVILNSVAKRKLTEAREQSEKDYSNLLLNKYDVGGSDDENS